MTACLTQPHARAHAEPPPAVALSPALLAALLHEHRTTRLPRLLHLWDYYRNPERDGQLAQAHGLPDRLRPQAGHARQVVIENDIAWRLHTQIDFMIGKGLTLRSTAPDPGRADLLSRHLRATLDAAGGQAFLHDLALVGAIYGYVDVLVRPDPDTGVALDLLDPPDVAPLLDPRDYRRLDALVVRRTLQLTTVESPAAWRRLLGRPATPRRATADVTHVWTAHALHLYTGPADRLTPAGRIDHPFGCVPVVHIQNLPQPFFYEGLGEVEPLIPLQDELNTRLCDRANRVTFQSFKMYLAKGIDNFLERPVGPGQMWQTDNEHAAIQEFGGDGDSPSEDAHILEIREALDKCSGVSPVAAGIVRDRVGNLTSENALRIVLLGLLARTQRKRQTYGRGIARLCELILAAADATGELPNTPDERGIRIDWPNPLPDDEAEALRHARLKLDLGVAREQVLRELGYVGEGSRE